MSHPPTPAGWPPADPEILEAFQAAWANGSWGQYDAGHVLRLESALSERFQVRKALTCSSGSLAVELALRAIPVGPGDEVILAAYDYFANFLSVHAVGAIPVLIDLDPNNWNMNPDRLAAAIGPATRAILVSHLHGGLVSMRTIREIAAERSIAVIEDAAQAAGARVEGQPAGSWGDIGILSFGGSKLLTAGRGGALLTSRMDLFQRLRLLMTRGGNYLYPISELQAALLLPQLQAIAEKHRHRLARVDLISRLLQQCPALKLFQNHLQESEAAFFKVGFQYDPTLGRISRQELISSFQQHNIPIDAGFSAFHVGRSPSRYRLAGPLPQAEQAHHHCLVLHHPFLYRDESEVEKFIAILKKSTGTP